MQDTMQDVMTKAHEVAAELPYLRAGLNTKAATEYAAQPDSTFDFGLRAVLDGFESRLPG